MIIEFQKQNISPRRRTRQEGYKGKKKKEKSQKPRKRRGNLFFWCILIGTMPHSTRRVQRKQPQKQPHAAVGDKQETPLEIMLHQEWCKVSLFTEKSIAALLPICALLKVWFLHDTLQWCNLCSCRHSSNQICFPDHLTSPDHQEILEGLLNGNLDFAWTTDGYQHVVFSICRYFLLDQDCFTNIFTFPHPHPCPFQQLISILRITSTRTLFVFLYPSPSFFVPVR